jgi:hypothetical protein
MLHEKTPVIVDLPEGLLLLATDNTTGRVATKSGALDHGLAGAVLMELLLSGRLIVTDGKLIVADTALTNAPLLDEALSRIADSRPRDAKHWVSKLAGSHIKDKILDRLTLKGILRKEEHRILWVIPADRYPAEDDAPEADLREAIRSAVLEGTTPRPRTAVLIGILKACDLLEAVFSRDERKQFGDRIDSIAQAELMGTAVSKAVKDMQAATMAAVTAATAAVVVTRGSSD